MTGWMASVRGKLRERLHAGAAEARMDEEIRFHVEMETEKNLRAGMGPEEARRQALLAFGGVEKHREALRDGRRIPLLEDLAREVGHAARSLVRRPGFAIVGVLTMAVAIGATTAIFSVVDAVLLRPLPYPDQDELVTVRLESRLEAREDVSFSDRGFWFFRRQARSFERFGGFGTGQFPLVGDGEPVQVDVARMTTGAFEAIGVAPALGRFPTPEEDAPGGPEVVLIGHDLWAGRYGRDPDVLGRTIDLNGREQEVVGVLPAAYDFPSPAVDVWMPYRLDPASENWGGHHIQVVARLRDGVSVEDARAEAADLIARIDEAGYDAAWVTETFTGRATVRTLADGIVGPSRRPLAIVLGTMGFVLLVACGNVAHLLLVRAEARSRETAVRAALGAGRLRLAGGVLLESLLIALGGGVLGLLLAHAGTRALVAAAPEVIPRLHEIRTSGSVLAFTSCVVLGVAVLVGVLPALRTAAGPWADTLRSAGRSATPGRDRQRARSLLVVAQVALTLVLLVGAGLMVRSFQRLRAVDPGFRTEGVLAFRFYLPGNRYPEAEAATRFVHRLVERIEALPGVVSAGGVNTLPLTDGGSVVDTRIEGAPAGPGDVLPTFSIRRVTPGYFETMGIPLLEGRSFEPRDAERRLGTAIVSTNLEEEYWPATPAVGRRLDATAPATIVGVVGDVRDGSLTAPPEQIIYLPLLDGEGGGARTMNVVVRAAAGDPLTVAPLVRRVVAEMDPLLPVTDVRTAADLVGASMSRITFTASLLLLAALIALLLGSVGIYGVLGYVVAQRTPELGIRQALGASPRQLCALVMRRAMALTVAGLLIGLGITAGTGGLLGTLLYGVAPMDPTSMVGGALVFLAVAAAAALLPALRAARVDPAVALRQE